MSEPGLIEKLTGQGTPQSLLYNKQRLQLIQKALIMMKQLNKQFLKKYELSDTWNKVNLGLIKHNVNSSLENIVELKVCEASKPDRTYFNPFAKKPITMCYNKFIQPDRFNQALSYNLVLFYDLKTKKNQNWNVLEDTVLANVRAIHISQICKRNDMECIKKELQSRVFEKQRFKGKTLDNLNELIMQGLEDRTPISQIILRDN